MSDRIDDVLELLRSDIDKAIHDALAEGPALNTILGVEKSADSLPYRIREVEWPRVADGLSRCAIVDIDLAYELTLDLLAPLRQLEDTAHTTIDGLAALARRARLAERTTVLNLVVEAALEPHHEVDALDTLLSDRQGMWRLLARDPIAAHVKQLGIVDVVDPQCRLPAGVSALLIKLDDGPTVRTVEDDFRVTWRREGSPASDVRFSLTQRFFVESAGRVIVLARV
jgi:hypothetical protein